MSSLFATFYSRYGPSSQKTEMKAVQFHTYFVRHVQDHWPVVKLSHQLLAVYMLTEHLSTCFLLRHMKNLPIDHVWMDFPHDHRLMVLLMVGHRWMDLLFGRMSMGLLIGHRWMDLLFDRSWMDLLFGHRWMDLLMVYLWMDLLLGHWWMDLLTYHRMMDLLTYHKVKDYLMMNHMTIFHTTVELFPQRLAHKNLAEREEPPAVRFVLL